MTNLYKEMNNIVDETDERHIKPLSEEEKHKLKTQFNPSNKKVKQHKQKWLPAAVAAAVLTLSSIPLLNDDVQAAAGRMVDQLEETFNHMFPKEVSHYSVNVGQTIHLKSSDITLSNIFVENNDIYYNMVIDMKGKGEFSSPAIKSVKINNQSYDAYQNYSRIININKKSNKVLVTSAIHIKQNIPNGNIKIELKPDKFYFQKKDKLVIPKDINSLSYHGKIYFKNRHYYRYSYEEEINNTFNFNTNKNKITNETEKTIIDKKFMTLDHEVNLYSFEINPVTAVITSKISNKNDEYIGMYLIDNNGVKYKPTGVSTVKINHEYYERTNLISKDPENTIKHLKKAKSLKFILIKRDNNEDTQNYETIIKKTDLNDAFEFKINH